MPDPVPLHAAPAPPVDALPASWSDSAVATWEEITRDHPNLDAAGLATLFEACALLAAADTMQARVDDDGLLVLGSQGQPVPHGLISEVRAYRLGALGALRALGLARGQTPASAAGATLAAKRHHGRTPGVRGRS